jgi:iron-sulfur cluster assembly accessory protein
MNLKMTPAAEKFIRRLLRFDGGPDAGFRLKVTPGGCSGLAAEFDVAAAPATGEQAIDVNGVKLFLAAESRLLLDGVTIDFADTPLQSGFVFQDPKLVACGVSKPVLVSLDIGGRT